MLPLLNLFSIRWPRPKQSKASKYRDFIDLFHSYILLRVCYDWKAKVTTRKNHIKIQCILLVLVQCQEYPNSGMFPRARGERDGGEMRRGGKGYGVFS